MLDIKMLDSLIALVVVILVLSLIVQSIQGAVKKLLKIKSRQLEDSLLDLFENTLGAPSARTQGFFASSPLLRLICFQHHPSRLADPKVRALFDAVSAKFQDIGRVAQSGRWALDSLAKDDLLKVLARVAPDTLIPDFRTRLEEACERVTVLEGILAGIDPSQLSGEASARLATVRQAIDPLLNDVAVIFKGNPRQLDTSLLVGDAFRLRQIQLEDVLGVLTELQKGIDQDLAAAQDPVQRGVLQTASTALKSLAAELAVLHSRFDAAIAPLRARLHSVESWFDTVMQSFEERYARGMKTWALVISLLVVIVLDAGFFKVARLVLGNDEARAAAVNLGEGLNARRPAAAQSAQPAVTSPANALATEPGVTTEPAARTEVAAATEPASASEPAVGSEPAPTLGSIAREAQSEVQPLAADYTSLGFAPLSRESLRAEWVPGKRGETLAGWLLMTMLLSVGAPFWQDALESLFGVKNLLRKRGDVQNVAQGAGEGNPKT